MAQLSGESAEILAVGAALDELDLAVDAAVAATEGDLQTDLAWNEVLKRTKGKADKLLQKYRQPGTKQPAKRYVPRY